MEERVLSVDRTLSLIAATMEKLNKNKRESIRENNRENWQVFIVLEHSSVVHCLPSVHEVFSHQDSKGGDRTVKSSI